MAAREVRSQRRTPFPFGAFLGIDGRHERSSVTFNLAAGAGLDRDMTWLAGLVAAGELKPGISWCGGWARWSRPCTR